MGAELSVWIRTIKFSIKVKICNLSKFVFVFRRDRKVSAQKVQILLEFKVLHFSCFCISTSTIFWNLCLMNINLWYWIKAFVFTLKPLFYCSEFLTRYFDWKEFIQPSQPLNFLHRCSWKFGMINTTFQ